MSKNSTGKASLGVPVKRPIYGLAIALLLCAAGAAAQNRSAELDKAYEDARAAYNDLQAAEARRDSGVESQPGERQSSAAGGSRPTGNYFARQAILEQEVEQAR